MNKTIVIYGSSTGTCRSIAETIAERLGAEALDVQNLDKATIEANDNLILGTSTWGAGEMQDDWYEGIKTVKSADLTGKVVALFGCGDCESYGDTFVSGMGELYNLLKDSGAHFVGTVPTDDYNYEDSEAVVGGKFVGLPLDETNEPEKTDSRIASWLEEIASELRA